MSIIDDPAKFDQLCRQIDEAGHFALDLEFIPERTYVPQLCLIQACIGQTAYIIDPLALKDLAPLWQRVADPGVHVVLHAGEQDLAIMHYHSGLTPANVLDTQIAAGFLGFGYPAGYSKLLQQLLGVNIAKTETYTDWMKRPLSKLQIEYALDDVRYLPAMERKLESMLNALGRLDWVNDECNSRYLTPHVFRSDPERDFVKVKGSRSLSMRGLVILRELFRLREAKAVAANRHPQKIIPDNLLLELARRPVKRLSDLSRIRGLRNEFLAEHGDSILHATLTALNLPESDYPRLRQLQSPSRAETMKTDVLLLLLKTLCHSENLAPDLVATRSELERFVRAFDQEPETLLRFSLTKDWRGQLIGKKLLAALDGTGVRLKLHSNGASVDLEWDEST